MVSGLLEGLARKRNNVSYLLAGIASRYFPTEILPNSRNVAAFVVLGVDFVVIAAVTLFLPFAAVVRYLGPNQELFEPFPLSLSVLICRRHLPHDPPTLRFPYTHLSRKSDPVPRSVHSDTLIKGRFLPTYNRGQGHYGHLEQGTN